MHNGKFYHLSCNTVLCRLFSSVKCESIVFVCMYRGGGESEENSDFEAKIRGVNSVSCEKLHDFEIICPAGGGGAFVPLAPSLPPPNRRTGLLLLYNIVEEY